MVSMTSFSQNNCLFLGLIQIVLTLFHRIGKIFSIFLKSRKKFKVHRSFKISQYKGKYLNFFFSFLCDQFFSTLVSPGLKKDKLFSKI